MALINIEREHEERPADPNQAIQSDLEVIADHADAPAPVSAPAPRAPDLDPVEQDEDSYPR